jgi:Pregnancy-associated plasma protein-A
MTMRGRFTVLILFCLSFIGVSGQQVQIQRCATVERLEQKFNASPGLRASFGQKRLQFNSALEDPVGNNLVLAGAVNTIPVIVHVVLPNPALVTDAQVLAQIDTLNKDYGGDNGDSVKIPSWFKPLFGKSSIRFCLARRTPDGQPTTGIHRVTAGKSSFSNTAEDVKYTSRGGTDRWDNTRYMNIWITSLAGGILGYSSFPGDGTPAEQGVVIDYRALPGGSFDAYDQGKTLTHETGHFFNLYHIWGDDDGACSGTDFVNDTPNQSNSSSLCESGRQFDNCTRTGDGIMYQNYMDYTSDACLVLFTTRQVQRMEASLSAYYPGLLTSNACQPIAQVDNDVQLLSVTQPEQRLCSNSFSPVLTIKNFGRNNLTALTISTIINSGTPMTYKWTGSLAYFATQTITLPAVTVNPGKYAIVFVASLPNNVADEKPDNNTLAVSTQYYLPVTDLAESFESDPAVPAGWDILNADSIAGSWEKTTITAADGNSAFVARNFGRERYSSELRLPELNIGNVDSAFLTFKVASTAPSAVTLRNGGGDTLDLLVSADCGQTSALQYRVTGNTLSTTAYTSADSYSPALSEWRKDSINLTGFINQGPILLSFRNGGGGQNNIYLDDVRLKTVTINPNLKTKGLLVTPNPAKDFVSVQFYPPPANLRSLSLYNFSGQKLAEIAVNGSASALYTFSLSGRAAGVYVISLRFDDHLEQRKIIKIN